MLQKSDKPTAQQVASIAVLNILYAVRQQNVQHWRLADHRNRNGMPKRPKRGYEYQLVGMTPTVHVTNGVPKIVMSKVMTLVEKPSKKYAGEKLRALRAERGVGKVKRG